MPSEAKRLLKALWNLTLSIMGLIGVLAMGVAAFESMTQFEQGATDVATYWAVMACFFAIVTNWSSEKCS